MTWPDDPEDASAFTNLLVGTYSYLRDVSYARKKDGETGVHDMATLVCSALFNISPTTVNVRRPESEPDLDDEW